MTSEATVGFGAQLRMLARDQPEATAITLVGTGGDEDPLTYRELHRWSNSVSTELLLRGVTAGSRVAIALPNSLEHAAVAWAAWKLGALVLPMNPRSPLAERNAMLEVASIDLLVTEDGGSQQLSRAQVAQLRDGSDVTPPDVIPHPGKAIGSGGSTGRPKLIVDPSPLARVPGQGMGPIGDLVGFSAASVHAIPGPLFHNMPFVWLHGAVFDGCHVVLLERFDAALLVRTIAAHSVEFVSLVPTMMRRVCELSPDPRDFTSLIGVMHSAAPCPPDVKRRWIELVGATVLWEGFGASENTGITLIRGDEWLERPGSVGRPFQTEIRIIGEDGEPLPHGAVGEVYMRRGDTPTYSYEGSSPASSIDGFVSVGDMGWLDDDGYLFPADRRVDLIITGGSNVYSAEVEAVLLEHPQVSDAVVIGLADPEWGKRVHAVVSGYEGGRRPEPAELAAWCRDLLTSYKVPKAFEVVDALPRDEAGKINKRAMVLAREPAPSSTL